MKSRLKTSTESRKSRAIALALTSLALCKAALAADGPIGNDDHIGGHIACFTSSGGVTQSFILTPKPLP